MDNNKQVLDINNSFYQAFHECNLAAMKEVWSRNNLVSVIHPGWPVIYGFEQVMLSWEKILQGLNVIAVSISNVHVNIINESLAHVTNLEHLDASVLAASNLYILEEGHWKMLHHQAGSVRMELDDEEKPLIH